jgi:hypothetical protein
LSTTTPTWTARERHGYLHPPQRTRTICRPITAFSLVMQPGLQRFWVGDLRVPAPLGRYIGFDLAGEAQMPDTTVPPSGFQHAAEGYQHFAAGRYTQAAHALECALELDGESAPLRLMFAQVYRALGQAQAAQLEEQRAHAAGALAGKRIPFPSAIQPLTYLTL